MLLVYTLRRGAQGRTARGLAEPLGVSTAELVGLLRPKGGEVMEEVLEAEVAKHRFTVEEFRKMGEAGILGEHYPDLVLYREGILGRVPEAGDALVVVEVADTSVPYDRNIKLPLYAHSGVPEAWLVDLRAGVVEVHSGPHASGYGAVWTYARGEVVRSATLAEVLAFGADEVLPR